MFELLVLWIVSAIVGGMILERYNKGGTGLTLGCLLGPLGCIIALVMRSNAASEEQRRLQAQQMEILRSASTQGGSPEVRDERECPFCAERILRKAIVCKYCGRDVPPQPESKAEASPVLFSPDPLPPAHRQPLPLDRASAKSSPSSSEIKRRNSLIVLLVMISVIVAGWQLGSRGSSRNAERDLDRAVPQVPPDPASFAGSRLAMDKLCKVAVPKVAPEGHQVFFSRVFNYAPTKEGTYRASGIVSVLSEKSADLGMWSFACEVRIMGETVQLVSATLGPAKSELEQPTPAAGRPTRASESRVGRDFNSGNHRPAMTSVGLSNADIAWHAVNTYGWDCEEVVSRDSLRSAAAGGDYFVVTCGNGTKLRVYPRVGKHPRITNAAGGYN
jgi:hypothetical protein